MNLGGSGGSHNKYMAHAPTTSVAVGGSHKNLALPLQPRAAPPDDNMKGRKIAS